MKNYTHYLPWAVIMAYIMYFGWTSNKTAPTKGEPIVEIYQVTLGAKDLE